MVENVKSNFVVNILDYFKISNPDEVVPKNIEDAVSSAEEQYTLFKSGADAKFTKWKSFRSGLNTNLISDHVFDSTQELNDTVHNYMDWQKSADELLTDAEKAQYTIENYKMDKRVNFREFLKFYRNNKNNKGFKGIFEAFAAYKAKINEGSFKYFLRYEYKNSANDVLAELNKAQLSAKKFNDKLADELANKVTYFEATTIKDAKAIEKCVFGDPRGVKAAKWGGRIAAAAALFMGIRFVYKYFTEADEQIARMNMEQPKPFNSDIKSESVEVKEVPASVVTDSAVQQTVSTEVPSAQESTNKIADKSSAVVSKSTEPEKAVAQEVVKSEVEHSSVQSKTEVRTTETKSEQNSQIPVAQSKPEEKPSKAENVKPAKTVTATDASSRAERRAAFNKAINKIKETLSTEGIECDSYTVVKNDTLTKIAITTLKGEPDAKQINQRIALIALLNEIEDVNMLYVNQTLKIPSAELNAYIENNEEYSKLLSEIAAFFA